MTTLQERLRAASTARESDARLLCVQAATALDAKEAENKALLSENDAQRFVMNTMRAEVERLREALLEINTLAAAGGRENWGLGSATFNSRHKIARMALSALSPQEDR